MANTELKWLHFADKHGERVTVNRNQNAWQFIRSIFTVEEIMLFH